MTQVSTYQVDRIEASFPSSPVRPFERRAVFQLTDVSWQLSFKDSKGGMSCGLLSCSLEVEAAGDHKCRVSVKGGDAGPFTGTLVLAAPELRVRRDLEGRLASLERSSAAVAAVRAGEWWWDTRLFDGMGWAHRCSIAGVRYRAGWWGTGRITPSMPAKVLDFSAAGITLRGWQPLFLIPWDAVALIRLAVGDGDRPLGRYGVTGQPSGTTLTVGSRAGQDARFFTPLLEPPTVRSLLEPLLTRLGSEAS